MSEKNNKKARHHHTATVMNPSSMVRTPLATHAGFDLEGDGEFVLIGDTIGREGTKLEHLGVGAGETNLSGRNEFTVLDHGLEALDRKAGVHLVCVLVDENLHARVAKGKLFAQLVAQTCGEMPRKGETRLARR